MSAKLERIAADRDKARKKRDEWEQRYKDLDRRYHEQENIEIHDMVHAANVTPEQLSWLLENMKHHMPNGEMITNENENREEQQND